MNASPGYHDEKKCAKLGLGRSVMLIDRTLACILLKLRLASRSLWNSTCPIDSIQKPAELHLSEQGAWPGC